MRNRIEMLRRFFDTEKLDGYLVANGVNIQYFTGFLGGSRLLILKQDAHIMYVSKLNYEAAKESVKDVDIEPIDIGGDVDKIVADRIRQLKPGCIGFDSLEASNYLKLKETLKDIEIKPLSRIVWSLRRVKDKDEIRLMKRAAKIASLGMEKAYEILKPGLKERELASEIEYVMRRNGSHGVAFDTIVASGVRSAFPHGGCSDREIMKGDFVVVDVGAKYEGYCADLTRTVILGEPSPMQRSLYNLVFSAQKYAIGRIKAGVKSGSVDAAARDLIARGGYGGYFVHRLGHGVGLEVHEQPILTPGSDEVLEVGNVLTVEPGVYIPSLGGVRIEDTVLVGKEEAEKLTDAPYTMYV